MSIPDTDTEHSFSRFTLFSIAAVSCVFAATLLVIIMRLVIKAENESGSILLISLR